MVALSATPPIEPLSHNASSATARPFVLRGARSVYWALALAAPLILLADLAFPPAADRSSQQVPAMKGVLDVTIVPAGRTIATSSTDAGRLAQDNAPAPSSAGYTGLLVRGDVAGTGSDGLPAIGNVVDVQLIRPDAGQSAQ